MVKFLVLGPVTRDTILKGGSTCRGVGGPVYYQSSVLCALENEVTATITLSPDDQDLLKYFPPDLDIIPVWGDETMAFENTYPDENPNHRIQRACIPVNPIEIAHLKNIDFSSYDAILISPLSPYDVPLKTLEYLSQQGRPVFLGAQGYLRHLEGQKVVLKPWENYEKYLSFVDFLFLDEVESRVIIEDKSFGLGEISKILSSSGPDDVIVTMGSKGSVIYSSNLDEVFKIPAFPSKRRVDPTGLGDSYLAAYALKFMETGDSHKSGIFASVVASLKLENKGAFQGNLQEVNKRLLEHDSLLYKE